MEEISMERRIINPWGWQDALGYVQANDVTGIHRVLICAGQAAMDANGRPVHAADMGAQLTQALDNVETILREAGLTWAHVVRLNAYTTDVDRFFVVWEMSKQRLAAAQCRPASTLLGVTQLAFPDLLVEIEVTAVT
jgi:2-iminobutanoate/2-iminopropanoate deaminase